MVIKSTDQIAMKTNLAPPVIIPDSPRPQKVTAAEVDGETSLKIPSIKKKLVEPEAAVKECGTANLQGKRS